MGIRFVCPNGHKLNVKAFLAGKRGICPDCDARFIVPELSGGKAVPVDLTAEVQSSDSAIAPGGPPSAEAAASISPDVQIEQLPEESFSPGLRKSRPKSRQERARRVTIALGSLILLLAVALVLVLWYQ